MSEPPPFPMPVEPLGYGNPYYGRRRPGILTAVGVLSIIVGGLSFLASALGGAGAFVLMRTAAMPMPVMRPAPATAPTTNVGSGGLVSGDRLTTVGEDGLDADQAGVVISVLERRRRLSDEQKAQLA